MATKISRRSFLRSTALASAAIGLGFYDSRKITTSQPFDTIIKGGTIFNGDGNKPIIGDIAIKNGKIAAIGNLGNSADTIIEANGLAISPGFIDIHTHTDTKLLTCPRGDSRIFQGITTDIGGNCGDSPFPLSRRFKNVDQFYNALTDNKIGINYASLIGQGQLRSAVVGNNNVAPTKKEMERMLSILNEQMEQGAMGISCGLEYAPGSYASNEELVELCKRVAHHNGLFSIHMRNEDDRVEESVKEAIDIARQSGVRLQISHLKAQNANNWHKGPSLIKLIEEAQKEGIDIAFDRYPYIAFSTGLTSFIPLNDRQGSDQEVVARLKDKAKSKEIGEYALSRFKRLGGAKNVVVSSFKLPENQQYIGKNLEECAAMTGLTPWDFTRKVLIEENLYPDIIGFAMTEENVKLFLSHPLGMPASDGSVSSPFGPLSESMPHPRAYGTFPRFLGKYCREEKITDLSTAIRKCTSLPASRLGLKERGALIPGYAADIVVFNPDTIIDTATFTAPHQFAKGIEYVFVNGSCAINKGIHTEILKGEIIRK